MQKLTKNGKQKKSKISKNLEKSLKITFFFQNLKILEISFFAKKKCYSLSFANSGD